MSGQTPRLCTEGSCLQKRHIASHCPGRCQSRSSRTQLLCRRHRDTAQAGERLLVLSASKEGLFFLGFPVKIEENSSAVCTPDPGAALSFAALLLSPCSGWHFTQLCRFLAQFSRVLLVFPFPSFRGSLLTFLLLH